MAKQGSSVVTSLTLPGKVVIGAGDKVNYRSSFGNHSTGTVAKMWDVGEYGWMMVLDRGGNYETVALVLQLQHIGVDNILIKE